MELEPGSLELPGSLHREKLYRILPKMTTLKQIKRAVISLAYRRRLEEKLPELESALRVYLQSKGKEETTIAGYKVILDNGDIILEEMEPMDFDQLELQFKEVN